MKVNHDKLDNDVSTIKTFKRLLPYLVSFKFVLVVTIICLILAATADTSLISLLNPLLNKGFADSDRDFLLIVPFYIVGLVFLRGLTNYISSYCLTYVSGKVVTKIRQQLFNHLVESPTSFFDQSSTGKLLSRITYDTQQVASATSSSLITIVRETAFIIGLITTMFLNSWQLSLALIIVAPIVITLIAFISTRFRKLAKNMQNSMGGVSASVEQMLKGHKDIIIFGSQKVEDQNFIKASNHFRRSGMRMVTITALSTPLIQVVIAFAIAFMLFMAANPDLDISPGAFTVVFSSMVALMQPIKNLTNVNAQFQKGMAACQTLFAIFDLPTEKDEGDLNIERVKGNIDFEHVTFTYPTRQQPALNNINFSIAAGKTIALVGRSGSGKSTIASLMMRFYDLEQGAILLDGHNIKDYTLYSLREQIGFVSQNVHLFNDTIANNITYGCSEKFTRQQIEQATRHANAYDFIMKMENGFDTWVGENGALLSGGQRQRIAIARALLRNSPILILDEATSALDTESERAIQQALEELQKNRTSIVIAHRLSTIEKADEILVIDNGNILEHGNHQQLLRKNGVYAKLYNSGMPIN
ncbi:lipid A ABC transporter ATP-binding protein/permease MsbA [Orbus sturtevantii]|uniref:lipid A ABC transporter ATP-binding protein/permease MsbA n=1 Tax=Orbus sturtevantii TaxID=3074109 RepID=UPI00370DA88D